MKTRSKIITIIAISVIGFLFIPVYVTHTYCDLFEPENGGCMRISGIGTGELTFYPPILVFDIESTCDEVCPDLKESESVYTLTEVHCFTNQVIYNDECVYVLIPTDERPKEMTKYFSMVDDVIINFCEIEIIASDRENHSGKALDRCFEISSYTISDVNVIKFQGTTPTIRIITEDRNDKLNPHQVVIDLEQTNVVTFVNNSPDPVRIQEVGENKIIDIPKTAWHTKTIESGEKLTMQFNSTGHYEFNVKKITDFLEGYFEHHATGDIVVLSNDTNSLPVEIRAKMAQSIVGSDFRKGVGLISVGSGGAEPGITIGIDEKFQHRPDAEQFYYEKYKKMIPFDVPIWIEFSAPIVLNG